MSIPFWRIRRDGFVDPDHFWEGRRRWRFADKTFRVGQVGGIEDELALSKDIGSVAEVDHAGSEQGDPGMAMLVVVPGEELLAEDAATSGDTQKPPSGDV